MPVPATHAFVTTHALERWRERFAPYADASEGDLLAVFHVSRRIGHDALVPFARTAGTHYHYHAALDLYFVVDARDPSSNRIVTVFRPACLPGRGPRGHGNRFAPGRRHRTKQTRRD